MSGWAFPSQKMHSWKTVAVFLVLACVAVFASHAVEVPASAPVSTVQPTVIKPAAKAVPKPGIKNAASPYWTDLTPKQQQALAPLALEWKKLDTFRKEKWLELANKFASMPEADQARMQDRMRDWVKLTPEQRRLARENYTRVKKLPPEQRSAQWEQYQQLPEEKKKQLAETVPAKKRIANPPLTHGAKAPVVRATKPVPAKQPLPTAEAIQPSLPLVTP